MTGFVETLALFGPHRALIGILTAPESAPESAPDSGSEHAPGAIAVIVVNTGITHRPGHHRLFVQWARALAASGHPVLRFDFSGVGDSAAINRNMDLLSAAQADLRDAADWMQAKGHDRIVLIGICAGADHAAAYAGNDDRIVGVVLIDPSLPTFRTIMLNVWQRVTRYTKPTTLWRVPAVAMRKLKRLFQPVAQQYGLLRAGPLAGMPSSNVRPFLAEIYGNAVENGVQFLALFTSYTMTRRGADRAFKRAFPALSFDDSLEIAFLDSDHLLVHAKDRANALHRIQGWLASSRFATPPTADPAPLRRARPAEAVPALPPP